MIGVLAFFSIGTALPVGASDLPPATLPPELAVLDLQFTTLQQERVTAPYEAGLAALNASYLGGIEKVIAVEKAAGHLDGVMALEKEKLLLVDAAGADPQNPGRSGQAKALLPEKDADGTLEVLKQPRAIWRSEHTKLLATRNASLKALLEPLTKRLAELEATMTKADRLADALTVRGYREALAEANPLAGLGSVGETAALQPPSGAGVQPINLASALAIKDGFTNSLGMKFIKVPGTEVLFCIHETRYQDYDAYAQENPSIDNRWRNQTHDGYAITERNGEHPVAFVSWEDAQQFCAWLSKKEGRTYRLPTDAEWSIAVGIGREEKRKEGTTPANVYRPLNAYPWGSEWPPPKGAGNYSDEIRKLKAPNSETKYIDGYDDGFPTSAPVMSYKPNKLGLYDMGGNVWEWVEDWYDDTKKERVLRGSSWIGHYREYIRSSYRNQIAPTTRDFHRGFRCVLELR